MTSKLRAFKITTEMHNPGDYAIYVATSAAKAKTDCMFDMRDRCAKATYSWIKTCRRAPEYDHLATNGPDCVAWADGSERWQNDKGRWRTWEEI